MIVQPKERERVAARDHSTDLAVPLQSQGFALPSTGIHNMGNFKPMRFHRIFETVPPPGLVRVLEGTVQIIHTGLSQKNTKAHWDNSNVHIHCANFRWKSFWDPEINSNSFILTSRALPKGLYRLFWTVLADEFRLAVKLYRQTLGPFFVRLHGQPLLWPLASCCDRGLFSLGTVAYSTS